MLFHIFDSDSLVRINGEHFADEILELYGHVIGNGVLSIQDLSVQFGCIFVFKGEESTNHGKKDDSCTPNIYHNRLIGCFSVDHLRCGITG